MSESRAPSNRNAWATSSELAVHGNVSFEPCYLERGLAEAAATGAGLALMHSHPKGHGWQDMSVPDIRAEQGNAGAVYGATQLPFVGLTIAGKDAAWSARFWPRTAPRQYARRDCGTVRVVGDRLSITYMDKLAPPPLPAPSQTSHDSRVGRFKAKRPGSRPRRPYRRWKRRRLHR